LTKAAPVVTTRLRSGETHIGGVKQKTLNYKIGSEAIVFLPVIAVACFTAASGGVVNIEPWNTQPDGSLAPPTSGSSEGTEWYQSSNFGYELGYPKKWHLATAESRNKVVHTLSAPDYTEQSIGKCLNITIIRISDGKKPYSFLVPTCPAEKKAGSLTVSDLPYTRCRTSTHPDTYRVAFTQHDIYFEFTYTSASLDSPDTKTIEGLIQCFKIVPRATPGMKAFDLQKKFSLVMNESARLKDENLVITNKDVKQYWQKIGDTGESREVGEIQLVCSDGSVMERLGFYVDLTTIHEPLLVRRWQDYTISLLGFDSSAGTVLLEVVKNHG
jgi:hypothetical protein